MCEGVNMPNVKKLHSLFICKAIFDVTFDLNIAVHITAHKTIQQGDVKYCQWMV